MTQTIEVTAAAPALQTQDASVGQVVGSRSVNDLPLNGWNFTFLAQVVAGVNTPQADTRGNAANGAFSANGMRPSQNNYLLDGIDNNSDNMGFLNGTNFVVLPPPDALSEFKVQPTNFSAQYGRAGGAILNATLKSGSNQIHGNLWEFLRNDKVDAADFFEDAPGAHKGEYRHNQYGGTIGGPVYIPHLYDGRNKLFFFADYEGTRRRQGSVFTNSVPRPLEKSVDLLPEWPGSYSALGVLYYQTGQIDKSRETLERFNQSGARGGLDIQRIEQALSAAGPESSSSQTVHELTPQARQQFLQMALAFSDQSP